MFKLGIVFLVRSWDELEETFNYTKISDDKDDYDYCVARCQYMEIETCRENGYPYFFLIHTEKTHSMPFKTVEDQAVFYEYELYSPEKKRVYSLNKYKLLLRTNYFEIKKPLEYLASLGAENLLCWEDELLIEKWYNHISQDFIKREIDEVTKEDITPELLKKYADKKGNVFLKTIFKDFGVLTDIYLSHFLVRNKINQCENNRQLLISTPLDLCRDEKGFLEYRVWVANHSVSSISRYLDYDINYSIPIDIEEAAQNFVSLHRNILPKAYVVDFGIDYSKGVVVIELNGLVACGRYEKNDFQKFLKDLEVTISL